MSDPRPSTTPHAGGDAASAGEAPLNFAEVIRTKRDGKSFTDEQIRGAIARYSAGDVPDYQMSALLMSIFFRGLDPHELATWTDAMLHSGDVLRWEGLPSKPVDKHSTGGVGDKISIPLAPAVAACGGSVPMISGRGLGHTGGTLDKLESIPGFRTRIPVEEARELMSTLHVAMMGQTAQVAPADRKLYSLRDVTSTVDSIPLIASSIMSKKLAEGIDGLVLDVKFGSGAFMKSLEDARRLADTLIDIGERCGCRTVAWLTRMDRPLGRAVGNALEIVESIEILRGAGPGDVRELVETLGGEMLFLAGVAATAEAGSAAISDALDDGRAMQVFRQMIEAQGGDPAVTDDTNLLPQAKHVATFDASEDGVVASVDCEAIGRACVVLGAGRARTDDEVDPAVGFEVLRTTGDRVFAGEPLLRIHYNDESKLRACRERLASAYQIGTVEPADVPLIAQRISRDEAYGGGA